MPDPHCLEDVAVCPQYLVAARMQQFTLSDLPQCMPAVETQPLLKVAKEVHRPDGGQEVVHLLVPEISHPADICVHAPHDDGVPPWEPIRSLILVQ